jgi:hypothetical protein
LLSPKELRNVDAYTVIGKHRIAEAKNQCVTLNVYDESLARPREDPYRESLETWPSLWCI